MASEILYERLRNAEDSGRPALAIELGKVYLEAAPHDQAALMVVGRALQSVARYEEAETLFRRALAECTAAAKPRITRQLGLLAQDRGEWADAKATFEDAIAAQPEDATAYIYLGGLLAKAGRLAEAEAVHRRAVSCAHGCIDEAWLNLGQVQRARGDYLGALESLREAQRLDPTDADTQAALEDVEAVLFQFPPIG